MYSRSYFLALILVFLSIVTIIKSDSCKGCLSLDEYNFDKVISRFKAVLVKFDVAFPYGDKHEVFTKLGEEVVANDDLILAEVGVKDYGQKDNEQLALKYGIGHGDLPSIRLFVKGKKPIKFSSEWTLDNLRNLIRDSTDIYVGLPGCLEKFDKLAMRFIASDDKNDEIRNAEKAADQLEEKDKNTANTYIKFMKKIYEVGTGFVKQEFARVNKILSEGKISDKKKDELSARLNILKSFDSSRDEL